MTLLRKKVRIKLDILNRNTEVRARENIIFFFHAGSGIVGQLVHIKKVGAQPQD